MTHIPTLPQPHSHWPKTMFDFTYAHLPINTLSPSHASTTTLIRLHVLDYTVAYPPFPPAPMHAKAREARAPLNKLPLKCRHPATRKERINAAVARLQDATDEQNRGNLRLHDNASFSRAKEHVRKLPRGIKYYTKCKHAYLYAFEYHNSPC